MLRARLGGERVFQSGGLHFGLLQRRGRFGMGEVWKLREQRRGWYGRDRRRREQALVGWWVWIEALSCTIEALTEAECVEAGSLYIGSKHSRGIASPLESMPITMRCLCARESPASRGASRTGGRCRTTIARPLLLACTGVVEGGGCFPLQRCRSTYTHVHDLHRRERWLARLVAKGR